MRYSIDNLVRLAKRDNNTIRPYLYVNPLQGKHIPTKPEDAMGMCHALAEIVNVAYPNDKLYVIGFAETATGIASAISGQNRILPEHNKRIQRERRIPVFHRVA